MKRSIAFLGCVALGTVAVGAWAAVTTVNVSQSELRGQTHVTATRIDQGVMLSGFELEFQNGGHKLAELGFMPASDRLNVVLRDGDGDDPYDVEIRYAFVANGLFKKRATVTAHASEQSESPLGLPISTTGTKVIQGFDLRFTNSDHFIGVLGVRSTAAGFKVSLSDKNFFDPFTATIDYGVLVDDIDP